MKLLDLLVWASATLILPTVAHESHAAERVENRTIGPYHIELFGKVDDTCQTKQKLRISRDAKVLATVEDCQIVLDPESYSPADAEWIIPRFAENITGNGIPNLVVYALDGNAYLNPTFHIFELGKKHRKIYAVKEWAYGFKRMGSQTDLRVFLGDEAIFGVDWGHVWGGQEVIMAFDKKAGRYRMSVDDMRKASPTIGDLAKTAENIRTDEDWEHYDGSLMLARAIADLVYSGNGKYVDSLLDLAWNPKFTNKAAFQSKLIECNLRKSTWWPELAKMNNWSVLKPNCV